MKLWTQFLILVVIWKYVKVQECLFSQIDLVYVIDSSASMGKDHFRIILDNITSIVKNYLNVEYGNVRIGVMTFNSSSHIALKLIDFHWQKDFKRTIDDIPLNTNGSKNTTNALLTMHNEMFTENNGDRKESPNIAIFITGGRSSYHSGIKEEAEKAKRKGIHIYAVGVGLTNKKELEDIATDPASKNMLQINDIDGFSSFVEFILNKLDTQCTGMPTTIVGTHDRIYKLGSPVKQEKRGIDSFSLLVEDGSIFWSFYGGCNIKKATLQLHGTLDSTKVTSHQASTMVVDWIGSNLYSIDLDFNLRVSSIKRKKSTLLRPMNPVQQIVVDPRHAIMFIVGGRSLYSMHMDGNKFQQILSIDTKKAYGPWTIDYNNLKLYGTIKQGNTNVTSVISCNYDGSNYAKVTETSSFVIGMAVHHDILYVFGIYGSLETFNIYNFTEKTNIASTRDFIRSVAVYDPEIQPAENGSIHPCRERPPMCSDVCLISPVEPYFKCACPALLSLGDDKRHCTDDPCRHMSRCDQGCTRTREPPYYRCRCYEGYTLDNDNKTCIGDAGDILLYVSGSEIKQIYTNVSYPKGTLKNLPLKPGCKLTNLVLDPVDKILFMTSEFYLYRSSSIDSVQIQDKTIYDIDIDWFRRVLYISKWNQITKIYLLNMVREETFASGFNTNGSTSIAIDVFHSVLYASSFSMSRGHYIIQINTDCHALEDRHNQGDKLLAAPQVKCLSGKMIFKNGRILVTKINDIISSLAFDANEGLLYFVTQHTILYVLNEGKPKQLKSHAFILNIVANGNALYWIEKHGANKKFQRGKYYRINKRSENHKSEYLVTTLVTSQTKTLAMTVGTIKTLHDGGETCQNNVTDCLGVEGGCKHLESNMICDRTKDCYGGFDEFYCCYNTAYCGIRSIHVNCWEQVRHQQHSIDLNKNTFDWETHPFSKLVKDESIASSICHVVGEYIDKNGKGRQFYINDLKESHILRQFSGKTSVFRQVSFTKYLKLNGTYFTSLETESFISFSMLTSLLITNTPLTNIREKAFAKLFDLVNLTITENRALTRISSKAMFNLASLEDLDISNNAITELKAGTFNGLTSLNSIDLRGNGLIIRSNYFQENKALEHIYTDNYIVCCMKPELLTKDNCQASEDAVFRKVNFIKYLTLNGTYLTSLEIESFIRFSMLTSLLITNTPLTNISEKAFAGLGNLVNLTITENKALTRISSKAMFNLASLEDLDISNNAITELKAGTFNGLTSLKSIDLRGNDLIIRSNFFQENKALEHIYTDTYIVCCMKPELLTTDNCHASKDAVSSCNDLIEDDVLRVFLWIIGITAALGNIMVVVYRFIGGAKSTNETFITFVTNLSVSDAMMGFYMLIIATHDAKFKGQYAWNEYDWKNSFLCELSGTISFVSSESSVLFILFITIDRFFAVKYPVGGPRITTKQAHLMSLLAWIIASASAIIPGQLYHTFYSYSGVCIALPLTVGYFEGTFYSVAVFLGFNFVIFLVIAFGQLVIFREIQLSSRRVRSSLTSRDRDAATMLLMVVVTDCFCWLPIGVLVIMALCGINTPNVIYAWIIVFVMPINSAINPFLYTLGPEIKKWLNRKSLRLRQTVNSRKEKAKYIKKKSEEGTMETSV